MTIRRTMSCVGLLAAAVAGDAAENGHNLRVRVPFAFVAGGQQFTPGAYRVSETDTGVITLQGEGRAAAFISVPLEQSKPGETSGLRFTSSDRQAFLTAVSVEGEGVRAVPHHSGRTLTLHSK